MPRQVEYRVMAVTRYIVTEWHHEEHENGCCEGGSQSYGEYDWERGAYLVANSLGMKAKSDRPDWLVKFPEVPEPSKI